MWTNPNLRCLLALAFLCLTSLVHSREIGSQGDPQNLKCVTHNLHKMVCTWEISSERRHGQTEFCYATECFKTKEERVEIPVPESSTTVKITTYSISGTAFATRHFEIHKKDISFVPLAPRILSLTPDFSTFTLTLKWSDNGSAFPYGLDASWEIEVLRNGNNVTRETYNSKLIHEDIIHSWNWKSDMPLECTSHHVRIRHYINITQFDGPKDWSAWSRVVVPGKDTEPSGSGLFPQDTVVAVGSNVTFCCVHKEGQQIQRMSYGAKDYPLIRLSSRSSAIRVLNANASSASGTNIVCTMSEDWMDGAVLFVGYGPDTPKGLSCETSNFVIIKCTWKPGRATGLYKARGTKYSLTESISGKNVSCEVNEMKKKHVCGFPVLADQKTYSFILGASNPIGQTEASLLVDLNQRVNPETPEKLTASGNSSTSVHLRWFINGSFAEIRLLCEIEISSGHSEQKLHNVSMPGGKFSNYTAQLNALHPYTKYQFRVRCSAADHFWRWSDWSGTLEYTTLEARKFICFFDGKE